MPPPVVEEQENEGTVIQPVNEGHAKGDTVVKSTVAINDNIVIVIQSQQAKNELVIKVQQPEVSNLFTLVTSFKAIYKLLKMSNIIGLGNDTKRWSSE